MVLKYGNRLLACALAAGMALSTAAYGAEFNKTQRSEIGDIVKEYLLTNPEILRDAFQELQRREQLAEAERLDKEGYCEVAQQLREEALDMGARPGAGAHPLIDELLCVSQSGTESKSSHRLPPPDPAPTPKRRRGRPPKRQPDPSATSTHDQ